MSVRLCFGSFRGAVVLDGSVGWVWMGCCGQSFRLLCCSLQMMAVSAMFLCDGVVFIVLQLQLFFSAGNALIINHD